MTGIQSNIGTVVYNDCTITGYLEGPYMNAPYLGSNIGYLSTLYLSGPYMLFDARCGTMGLEALRVVDIDQPTGVEALRVVDIDQPTALETLATIDVETPTGIEVLRLATIETGVQSFIRLYNLDKLRILCQFDSRGVVADNWTVFTGGQAAGDFNVNNVNTDIWEEIFRSVDTLVRIDCDTGVDASSVIDTIWLGNHNISSGATITVLGSNDPTFNVPAYQVVIQDITKEQLYYIWPDETYPPVAVRYYRFIISDPTNPDGYIQMAHILFGTSIIFNGDCITQNIRKQILHFKDEIPTEGFTSNMNNRAVRKKVSFSFENLAFGLGNYTKMVENVFLEARTDLKCLWIPYPLQPTRFGIFGKMTEIPEENHNVLGNANEDLDFISFDITVDESL